MTKAHVLLVDPDASERARLVRYLDRAGVAVTEVTDPTSTSSVMYARHPGLVILAEPSIKHAREEMAAIRALTDLPVILLVGERVPDDQANSAWGASIWLTTPVGGQALLTEVMRLLGRTGIPTGTLVIDWEDRLVYRSGEVILLTRKEHQLLELLAHHEGKVLSSERLGRTLWESADRRSRLDNLKHYVWCLRRKIETDPHKPRYLQTVPGVGYRFELK